MDIEKLIERLSKYSEPVIAYKLDADFAASITDAISELRGKCDGCSVPATTAEMIRDLNDAPKLRAENEKLREKIEDARLEGYAKGLGEMSEENERLWAELEEVKRVLAMMWYAYENKDGEAPHEYEIEARRAADKVLGPWAECMPKYLRNSQESSLCDTCAHPFDEVCKGCSDGNRYEPKAPEEPVRIIDEITEFTRDQWDWLMGRFTRKED